jgi:hypothetical protein
LGYLNVKCNINIFFVRFNLLSLGVSKIEMKNDEDLYDKHENTSHKHFMSDTSFQLTNVSNTLKHEKGITLNNAQD